MKFDQIEKSELAEKEQKHKTRGVIILTDNRPKFTPEKKVSHDFRESAFKQTEIDPLEVWADVAIQHDEDQVLQALNKRLNDLEERVRQLERSSQMEGNQLESLTEEKDKKARRKFAEMDRNFKCPIQECARIYGSQTSLRHHLKLKHKIDRKLSQRQSLCDMLCQ